MKKIELIHCYPSMDNTRCRQFVWEMSGEETDIESVLSIQTSKL